MGILILSQRFRETRNLCFSLNLADDQLAALAVQGMLPTWKENCWDKNLTTWVNWLNEWQRSIANSRVCAEIPDFRGIPQWSKLIIHAKSLTAMKMKKKRLLWLNGIRARRQ